MTEEQINMNALKYARENSQPVLHPDDNGDIISDFDDLVCAYIAGAHSCNEEIEVLKSKSINIFRLSDHKPEPDERVMVWHDKFKQWLPQVYDEECECWDTEDGDDYDFDWDPNDCWFSLPDKPE